MSDHDYFPYNHLLCIEASNKHMISDEIKKVMFPDIELSLVKFSRVLGVCECVIVQKCNCVEIYLVHSFTNPSKEMLSIREGWENILGSRIEEEIWKKMHFHYAEDAINHLFRVISSLESLIVGDNQVCSQVTNAYYTALKQGTVDDVLSHIFKESFRVAKKIHEETLLHGHGVSIGRAAAAVLMAQFRDPAMEITVVGSGQISEIVVNAIQDKWPPTKINIVTNREEFIDNKYCNPLVIGFKRADMLNCITESEAVVFCTNSVCPIFGDEDLCKVLAHGKLMVLIDLGMPPNAEFIHSPILSSFTLFDVVEFGRKQFTKRLVEAKKAEAIIEHSCINFDKTIIDYKREKILKQIGPAIHREVQKNNVESSIMGLIIKVFNHLDIEELDAIEYAIQNVKMNND